MKLANIVPVKNIKRTFDGEYAMLLAHLSPYYKPLPRNKLCYVIMDNSLIELGGAVGIHEILEAADKCAAVVHEIVLPDVFQDGYATLESVCMSLSYLHNSDRIHDYNLMAVCHGKTWNEFYSCFKMLSAIPEINTIAIPKVTGDDFGTRYALEDIWLKEQHNKQIHLLGVHKSMTELTCYKKPECIRSVDTCIPALLASRNIVNVWEDRPGCTINLKDDFFNDELYDNLRMQLRLGGIV